MCDLHIDTKIIHIDSNCSDIRSHVLKTLTGVMHNNKQMTIYKRYITCKTSSQHVHDSVSVLENGSKGQRSHDWFVLCRVSCVVLKMTDTDKDLLLFSLLLWLIVGVSHIRLFHSSLFPPLSSISGDDLPFRYLRLLAPPLQLLSAAVWQVVQQGLVDHYGMLEEFVTMVTELVPELMSYSQRAQLVLGLRARVCMCSLIHHTEMTPNLPVGLIWRWWAFIHTKCLLFIDISSVLMSDVFLCVIS